MTADSAHRSVRLERKENSRYTAINDRGGKISMGTGQGTDFTPVELLLAAIGGCTAVDVDILTSRRAEPDAFEILVDAEKVRDAAGNHLTDLVVTFRITFPDGEEGDAAKTLLPDAVKKSHDRLCTVSRTVELGTPVATRIELGAAERLARCASGNATRRSRRPPLSTIRGSSGPRPGRAAPRTRSGAPRPVP
jgi:putative redox protein